MTAEGGYLIPTTIRVKRKGNIAWFCRLLGKSSGWEDIDLVKAMTEEIKGRKVEDASN